jgi:hypothetical protein
MKQYLVLDGRGEVTVGLGTGSQIGQQQEEKILLSITFSRMGFGGGGAESGEEFEGLTRVAYTPPLFFASFSKLHFCVPLSSLSLPTPSLSFASSIQPPVLITMPF